MNLSISLFLLTNFLPIIPTNTEVQWKEIETLIRTYLCTGDTSWTSDDKLSPRLEISVKLPTDLFCDRPINLVEYHDLMVNVWDTMGQGERGDFTRCTSEALGFTTNVVCCCPQLKVFLKGLMSILSEVLCEGGSEMAGLQYCEFVKFASSEEGIEEFYLFFKPFCSGCLYPLDGSVVKKRSINETTLENFILRLTSNQEASDTTINDSTDRFNFFKSPRKIYEIHDPVRSSDRKKRQYDQESLVHVLQDLTCGRWEVPLPDMDEGMSLLSAIFAFGKLGCCFFKIIL